MFKAKPFKLMIILAMLLIMLMALSQVVVASEETSEEMTYDNVDRSEDSAVFGNANVDTGEDSAELGSADVGAGEDSAELGSATVTISYPGVKNVTTVQLKSKDGKTYTKNYTNDSCTFGVPNGVYDITVKKGGMVYKAEKVPLAGAITYEIPLTTLRVNFPGVKSVNQTTISVGSTSVVSKAWTNDKAEFTLFKGLTYNLKVQKGGLVHEATVACNEDEASYDVPLTTLTINFTGVKNVNKTTVSVGSTSVVSKDWANNTIQFILFRNVTYNLKLQKGTMVHEGSITCDDPEEIYNVPICHVTVLFDGRKATKTAIGTNGSDIEYKTWQTNSSEFYVFQGSPYYVTVEINNDTYRYYPVDCNRDEVFLGE